VVAVEQVIIQSVLAVLVVVVMEQRVVQEPLVFREQQIRAVAVVLVELMSQC
tara:strand:- start:61 stop:216 length:156 start_codon:yes stop_codon:yes gene_type:complete